MGEQLEAPGLDLEAFSHVVAHDLGAPLRGISVHLKLLSRDLDAGEPEKARERIDLLQERLRRMDGMLHRIREFAYVHASAPGGPTRLSTIVHDTWENLETDVAMTLDGDGDVAVGRMLAAMAVGELLRNASTHGGSDVTVRIARHGGHVAVHVQDEGPGLPADPESLFMPFGPGGDQQRGAGLALARFAARTVGGDLRLIAGQTKGTEAVLTLPAA